MNIVGLFSICAALYFTSALIGFSSWFGIAILSSIGIYGITILRDLAMLMVSSRDELKPTVKRAS